MVMPWAFPDRELENTFQAHRLRTLLDSNKTAFRFLVCCAWVYRLVLLICCLTIDQNWKVQSDFFTTSKSCTLLVSTICICIPWSSSHSVTLAKLVIWASRFDCFVALAEQTGLNQPDSSHMISAIGSTIMLGLTMQDFRAFAMYTVIVFAVKPVRMAMTGNQLCLPLVSARCWGKRQHAIAMEHFLVAFALVGLFCRVSIEVRRDWLLSYEVFGPLNSDGDQVAAEETIAAGARPSVRRPFFTHPSLLTSFPIQIFRFLQL